MRQIAVFVLAALTTGWSGSLAIAQSRAFEAQDSQTPVSQSGSAVTDPTEEQNVTEEEFLGPLFQADSPWVRSLGEELGARTADLALAKVFEEPEVAATQEDLGNGGTETQASVSWQLPRPDRRRLDIERAFAEVTAAESSFDRALLDFSLDLRRAYADWAIAARKVEVLVAEANLLRELARRSEERGRVGESSGLEVRRIRLAEMEARARATVSRAELATARGEVAAWRPDFVAANHPVRPVAPTLAPAPTSEPPTPPAVAALEAEVRASGLASGACRQDRRHAVDNARLEARRTGHIGTLARRAGDRLELADPAVRPRACRTVAGRGAPRRSRSPTRPVAKSLRSGATEHRGVLRRAARRGLRSRSSAGGRRTDRESGSCRFSAWGR